MDDKQLLAAAREERDENAYYLHHCRTRLDNAEKCVEAVRSALAMVAPRSLTFRRIRDALNRYDEAK